MSLTAGHDGATDMNAVSNATPSDYFALLKPRVMSLVVFTALTGLIIAPGGINPVLGFTALLAIAIGAGASGALNMWYDADIDAVMRRTQKRPIPSGKVTSGEALAFGLVLAAFSVATLGLATNWLAAGLLAFTIFFYAVIYTMWLKRSTPQNIVIGGAAGAFPPMIAYSAVTGTITLDSLILFLIIFVWTPPHFWALALVKQGDYANAGVPMMPNVKGPDHTRLEILVYTIVLAPIGCLPFLLSFGGITYLAVSALGGLTMLWLAAKVFRIREGAMANKQAMRLFGFSILYLFALFATLLGEHLVVRMQVLWS
ncbi:heme o synthase [Methylovirgula sp. 4M-Z18]|uniref:heme o synthase n=1 Tax=Methylovirgula sp. 4M-Z18 TaxID=2293567 RepID=UPI000E2EE6E2|nr:protoheme IX farnesyltransferase [Methylovirgula sp. 4M-Z18]